MFVNRLYGGERDINQNIIINLIINRISHMTNKITELVDIIDYADILYDGKRNVDSTLTFSENIDRIYNGIRDNSLVINIITNVNKINDFFRSLFNNINIFASPGDPGGINKYVRQIYERIRVSDVINKASNFFRNIFNIFRFIGTLFGMPEAPVVDDGGQDVGAGRDVTERELNLTVKIDDLDKWYFNNINILKFSVYDGEYTITPDEIWYNYYNNTQISINKLNLLELEKGIYEQEFIVYNQGDFKEKQITIDVFVDVNNTIANDSTAVIIYEPNIITQTYIDLKNTVDKTSKYILYFIIGAIVLFTMILVFIFIYDIKKNKNK